MTRQARPGQARTGEDRRGQRERQRERDRERERQRESQRDRQTVLFERPWETERQTERQRERQRDKETDSQCFSSGPEISPQSLIQDILPVLKFRKVYYRERACLENFGNFITASMPSENFIAGSVSPSSYENFRNFNTARFPKAIKIS